MYHLGLGILFNFEIHVWHVGNCNLFILIAVQQFNFLNDFLKVA